MKKPFLVCRGKTFFWAGKRAGPSYWKKGRPQLLKKNSRIEETGTLAVKKPFLVCRAGKTFYWAGKTAPVNFFKNN